MSQDEAHKHNNTTIDFKEKSYQDTKSEFSST